MHSGKLRVIILSFLVAGCITASYYCKEGSKNISETVASETSKWLNVYDSSIHYVGMETCKGCHIEVYNTFIKTGMGQSFAPATRQKSAADFSPSHALVYDAALNYYYKPFWGANDSLYIKEFRLQGKDTIHSRTEKVSYIIGSGQHTNSHIIDINGFLYQAPITFYTQKQRWDLAPGFENGANSRFTRPIELQCMSCHNGYPAFDDRSLNRFTALKSGIDCERCHGPGSLHVAEKQARHFIDTSKEPDYTIVNPRRLSTELQNNICQRCHLQGIGVLNNGKSYYDFHPGMKLSEVMNVFMPEYEGAKDKMIMASHVERMKKSRCYVESRKMSCITCHNPHISVKVTPRDHFIAACNTCHGAATNQKQCTESPVIRARQNNDCIACHMHQNTAIDIPHVAVTDHYIRKRPLNDDEKTAITGFIGMVSFNNPHPDAISKARGYLEFYETYRQSNAFLDSAIRFLNEDPQIELNTYHNTDLVRAYYLKQNWLQVIDYAKDLLPAETTDPWSCYRIGQAFLSSSNPQSALPWFKRSTDLKPLALNFQSQYGFCLLQLKQLTEAEQVFKFIIGQNPEVVLANTNLGNIYMASGNAPMAYLYLSKAISLDPGNIQALRNIAVWYHNNNRLKECRAALDRLLILSPDDAQVKQMLLSLNKETL